MDQTYEDLPLTQLAEKEHFAHYNVDECYDLEKTMGYLSDYFDYERFARELFIFDDQMGEYGNVFGVI